MSTQKNETLDFSGRFPVVRTLQKSLYGHVFLCHESGEQGLELTNSRIEKESEHFVAIKYVDTSTHKAKQGAEHYPAAETRIIQKLSGCSKANRAASGSRYIVRAREAGEDSSGRFQWLVMEYCPNGDLFSLVEEKGRLSTSTCRKYCYQLAEALSWCHQNNVAHMDLSLENILLDEKWDIKLADFGLAVESEVFDSARGKLPSMAPEVYAQRSYDTRLADAWSLGAVLFMMLTGSPLYKKPSMSDNNYHLVIKYGKEGLQRILDTWKRQIDPDAIDLLSKLLCPSSVRFGMKDVLDHEFLNLSKTSRKKHCAVRQRKL